ncbi:MAG: EAL domain-containing protein, partial [Propionivibrio sp.]|nr:EAL domain-containing protein [Propionivibrio sp.]
ALDDFGTGYSSLTYLRRLSADCLKIDQSFVREMLVNPDDFIIFEGVINMGNAFRRDTIAEGVETIEHGVLLLQLGCENAQGYGVARPMPPGDLPGWIAAWKPPSAWIGQEPVSKRFFPVLLASIEHRAWLDTLNKHLETGSATQPQLNLGKCRFSVWLDNESRDFPDLQERCQRIDQIHQKTHEMAEQLCTLYSEGKNGETRRRLAENLSASSTGLLDELSEFVANC